jgi:hypothetical protein
MYKFIYIYIYIYAYIYICRDFFHVDNDQDDYRQMGCICMYICIYIYIIIFM